MANLLRKMIGHLRHRLKLPFIWHISIGPQKEAKAPDLSYIISDAFATPLFTHVQVSKKVASCDTYKVRSA